MVSIECKENNSMFLYHYFEREREPFLSLSNSTDEEAQKTQDALKADNNIYVRRDSDGTYMFYRRLIENRVRSMFVEKGGKPTRQTPHYMIIGKCDFCKTWYKCADYIKVPIKEFDMNTVSFTYGDTFPTFDPTHGDKSEYRQNIYTYDEIKKIIEKYGWPQELPWNEDTPYWQPLYVEAQVWSDVTIKKYRDKWLAVNSAK